MLFLVAALARRWQNVVNSVVLTFTGSNMTIKFNQLRHAAPWIFVVALLPVLAACGSIKLANPFASDAPVMSSRPVNATAYVCADNKHFYVRMLNNGNDAWLIYPDHEVNLTKVSGSNNQFSSGVITLVIDGAETMLTDGEKIAYTACKPQVVAQ
jgi:membrane-bound inhibitor of C-type lysozyme